MTTASEALRGRKPALSSAIAECQERYRAATPRSAAQHEKACEALPGGNTRSALHYEPYPVTVARGEGSRLWDLDGNVYTDFLGEFSAALYGHSHPKIRAAVRAALDGGIAFAGPNEHEAQLASLLCERFPSCERVRFCNSGTEANLFAFNASRVFTGRTHILVFQGGYHGGAFTFAGGNHPVNAPYPFVLAEYNDIEGALARIEQHAGELAAIALEPMIGSGGCIPADGEFLKALREAADRHGIVLIFDEVMTSRLSPGGLQALHGVTPDVTSLGKYIGGGLTFGAFGGRREIIDQFDPRRPDALPHAGTFNNDVLTMTAGLTGLREIYTPEVAVAHNARGDRFRAGLGAIIARHDFPAQVTGLGSLLCVHFQRGEIRRPSDTAATHPDARRLFHLEMLNAGFYLARRGFMSLSLPLEDEDYASFARAIDEFLQTAGAAIAAREADLR